MMGSNIDLEKLQIAFRTRPGQLTYEDMCSQLISFANDYMLPSEEQMLNNTSVPAVISATKMEESNSSLIASNLSAMLTNVQSPPSSLQIQCFKCGDSGHKSANCSVAPTKPCLKCGEHGHFPSECPHCVNASSGKQCFECGEHGHFANQCKISVQSILCRNCGGVGHIASQCSSSLIESSFSNTVLGKRQQPYQCPRNNQGAPSKFMITNSGAVRTRPKRQPSRQAHIYQIADQLPADIWNKGASSY
jgi:hypothetical protein